PCSGCDDQGARQATLGPHHAHWSWLHRFPERTGRGRAPADREARQRRLSCCPQAGVHMGRKPKLTELQRRVARERVAKGESARSIAQEWGVAHTTVARAVA